MLFSNKNRDDLILILDVQSSIVYGALVLLKTTEKPRILFTSNYNFLNQRVLSSTNMVKQTVKATTQTIDEVMRYFHSEKAAAEGDIPKKISAVHYVLSSPWILSEAKKIETTFDGEKVITDPMAVQIAGFYLKTIIENGEESGREMYMLTVPETLEYLAALEAEYAKSTSLRPQVRGR